MIIAKIKAWARKSAILSYIATHESVDGTSIILYTGMPFDNTAKDIQELLVEGKIEQHWNGGYYEVCIKK